MSRTTKAKKRDAGGIDSEGLRAENLGSPVRTFVGESGKVSVRAVASAYEKIGRGELITNKDDHDEDVTPEPDLNLEDEELVIDDDDNLVLDDDDTKPVGNDDEEELDLDDDDELDLDDESPGVVTRNVGGEKTTAKDLGEDDDELQLDDEIDLDDTTPAVEKKPQPTAAGKNDNAPPTQPTKTGVVSSALQSQTPDGMPVVSVQSHLLPNNKFLREAFRVVKVDEGALLGVSKKERIWDVDFFAKKFSNLDLGGYKSFSQPAANLFRVEKHLTDPRRLTLYFFDAPHPYDLIMTSAERRNRFFELALVQRRNSVLWCPSLCPEGVNDAIIHLIGTSIQRPSGKIARVNGDGKFTVARMPYEIIDFWFGCISLQQNPIPASYSIVDNFLPKGTHDVYVVGIADIPRALIGRPDVGAYFHSYLGPAYHLLSQTILEGRDDQSTSCNGIVVFVRRTFILRAANIDAVEIGNVKDGKKRGEFTLVAAQVRINESTICCVMVNASPTTTLEPNVRSAGIRAQIAAIEMGNQALDIGIRYDYLFVAGCLGFDDNWSSNDALVAQQKAGNLLQEMKEAEPDPLLKSKAGAVPFRFLYYARPGTCRVDIKRYYAANQLHLNNAAVSTDMFTLRPFLSTFGEYVPGVILKLSNVTIVNQRIPDYSAGEILFSGEWLENAPISIHMQKDIDGYKIPESVLPTFRPVIHHHEYVRLQHLQFSLLGYLPSTKQASLKQKPKKIIIASGSLPLKTTIEKGFTKEFATPLVYRGCIVGSLVGSITYRESKEGL